MTTTVGSASVRNVVITRSKQGNEELAIKVKRAGFNPISVDTISPAPPEEWSAVDGLLQRLHSFDWLIFTSGVGVEMFANRMKALSLRLPWQGKPLVATVGERTAEKLSAMGVKASFVPSSYLTERLAEELPLDDGNRVLLLHADIADPKMSERMRRRGYEVEEAAIYALHPATGGTADALRDADLIVFASPSAVRGFCGTVPRYEITRLQGIRTVCIGPVTAAAAKENGFTRTTIPRSYTLDAVIDEIVRLSLQDA